MGPIRRVSQAEAILQRKRDEFEKALKLNRHDLKQWVRYAKIEIQAQNFSRARSIFERALAVDYTSVMIWMQYAQFEATNTSYYMAVAVLKRAVELLPMNSSLWLKYAEYERNRGTQGNREYHHVFTEWGKLSPDMWPNWYTFETRCRDGDPSMVLEQWISCYQNNIDEWVSQAQKVSDKNIFKKVLQLDYLSQDDTIKINSLIPDTIQSVVLDSYTEAVQTNGSDIALWWATLNNVPSNEMFESAIKACLPEKTDAKNLQWRMYAILWLRYAVYQELHESTADSNPGSIYQQALAHWNHSQFTSVTLWRNYALYYLRINDLAGCRKAWGAALGKTKQNLPGYLHILADYLDMEKQLNQPDRCRILYRMQCLASPQSSDRWISWAEYENELGEIDRCVYIIETALELGDEIMLDNKDPLWYLWAEVEGSRSLSKARSIWEDAILYGSNRGEVYMQYAMYELSLGWDEDTETPDVNAITRARSIFRRGMNELEDTEELQNYFLQFEEKYGDPNTLFGPEREQTKVIDIGKDEDDDLEGGNEEGDEELTPIQKLLLKAKQWSENTK